MILAGVVIFFQTSEGTVKIEINDPNIKVTFNGETFSFDDDGTEINVKPGAHQMKVQRGSLSFETEYFAVNRGETTTIKVTWIDGKLTALRGDSGVTLGLRLANPLTYSGPPYYQKAGITPVVPRTARDLKNEFNLVRKFEGHTGTVRGLAVSPDGKWIASSVGWPDSKSMIRIWNLKSGKPECILKHLGAVNDVRFLNDGRLLSTGSRHVRLWDVESGKELRSYEMSEQSSLTALAVSPDEKIVAAGSFGTKIDLWDIKSGKLFQTLVGHEKLTSGLEFSRDGKLLYASSNDKGTNSGLVIWDLQSGKRIRKVHSQAIHCFSITKDGKQAVCGKPGGLVAIFDLATGHQRHEIKLGERITKIAVLPSKSHACVVTTTGELVLWNLETGIIEARNQLPNTHHWAVAPSPDGKHIITGGGRKTLEQKDQNIDYSLRLWRLPESVWPKDSESAKDQVTLVRTLSGHSGSGPAHSCLAVSEDGKTLLSAGGADKTARVWNLIKGTSRTLSGPKDPVVCVALSKDNQHAAAVGYAGNVYLWDLKTARLVRTMQHGPRMSPLISFSPDGKRLITASHEGNAIAWDVATGIAAAKYDFQGYCWDSFVLSDNKTVVIGFGPFIKFWNLETGQVEDKCRTANYSAFFRFSKDEKTLVTGSIGQSQGSIQVWDTTTWKELRRFDGHTEKICSVEFLPNERYIISGSSDGRIILWDRQTGEEVTRIEGLGHLANSALPILDGRQVASFGAWNGAEGNLDSTDFDIRIWRLPESVWSKE